MFRQKTVLMSAAPYQIVGAVGLNGHVQRHGCVNNIPSTIPLKANIVPRMPTPHVGAIYNTDIAETALQCQPVDEMGIVFTDACAVQ